ncbi:MAG: FliM/FliN family flagellar motor C-terminal domain-containing protein, partial [Roseobacter sp.]
MTVPKALRVALAKVADDRFGMALAVIGYTQEKCAGDELSRAFGENNLLLMLDGPNGKSGGAILEPPLVSAMVQKQTTGRVSSSPAPQRRMTATDAALCAPLLDAFFERAHGILETDEDKAILPPCKFGAHIADERLFGLALDGPEYNVLRLTVDIAGGLAQATIVLVLPVPAAKPVARDLEAGAPNKSAPRSLERVVMGAEAELTAVLCRLHLSLSDIGALQPGEKIAIPAEAFDAVELTAIDGTSIGKGAMGQVDGKRALMVEREQGARPAQGPSADGFDSAADDVSDYSNLNLPDLDLSTAQKIIDPSTLDTLSDASEPDGLTATGRDN